MSDTRLPLRIWRKLCWCSWRSWNRTRYYWPQAQARKRAGAYMAAEYQRYGVDWRPPSPWWWPFGWWYKRREEAR